MTAKIKIGRNHQRTGGNHRPGIRNGWILPVFIGGVLLVLAILLVNLNVRGTFTEYANCHYVIVTQLKMDPFFCDGYDVKVFDATLFSIPGMKGVMDPTLERVRLAVAWGVMLLFASASLLLTIIIVNIKTVVGLLALRKEEWRKILAGARVWLVVFVVICAVFYLAVVK